MVISKKTIIFQGFQGGPTFSRGGGCPTFSRGGPNPYFYRNPYHLTCDFQESPNPLSPPLDPHMMYGMEMTME